MLASILFRAAQQQQGMVLFLISILPIVSRRLAIRWTNPPTSTYHCGAGIATGAATVESSIVASTAAETDTKCDGCDLADAAIDESKGSDMIGSVKQYDRHVLICGAAAEWPKKIESACSTFPMSLIPMIEAAAERTAIVMKLTACHHVPVNSPPLMKQVDDSNIASSGSSTLSSSGSNGSSCSEGEAAAATEFIVYPDNLLFTVAEEQAESFAKLVAERAPIYKLPTERLRQFSVRRPPFQSLLLVCTHGNRDKRCGRAGPQVIEALQQQLAQQCVPESEVAVRASSHIGGHKFAGTLIVYPAMQWYGRITKSNTEQLLQNIRQQRVMQRCSRGLNISSINDW